MKLMIRLILERDRLKTVIMYKDRLITKCKMNEENAYVQNNFARRRIKGLIMTVITTRIISDSRNSNITNNSHYQ